MENLKDYSIKFIGLRDGSHSFDYNIGKEFFDAYEISEIQGGEIVIHVTMEKSSTLLVFNFTLSGSIIVECDLCLDPMETSIDGNFRQIVKLSDEEGDTMDEEIVFLPTSEFEINLAPFISEFIYLCIPTKKVHPDGECNDNVQSVLNQYLLTEETNNDEPEEMDPRWEALKAIKKKKE